MLPLGEPAACTSDNLRAYRPAAYGLTGASNICSVSAVDAPCNEFTTLRNSSAPRREKDGNWWTWELLRGDARGEPERDETTEIESRGICKEGRARVCETRLRCSCGAGLEWARTLTEGVGKVGYSS